MTRERGAAGEAGEGRGGEGRGGLWMHTIDCRPQGQNEATEWRRTNLTLPALEEPREDEREGAKGRGRP